MLKYKAIVIGTSAGGPAALVELLPVFPPNYALPVIIVQHVHPAQVHFAARYAQRCKLKVKEADEKEAICPGRVYFAPPNYHLLIEDDQTFSLSVDDKVNYSRPAIDVLFESAADVYGSRLIGVILTGANDDGARGLRRIKQRGGLAVAQDPATAQAAAMPRAAIELAQVDYVLPLADIGKLLIECGLRE
jgi:two-component system chemotaxis response regulator CheB